MIFTRPILWGILSLLILTFRVKGPLYLNSSLVELVVRYTTSYELYVKSDGCRLPPSCYTEACLANSTAEH
ncbi:hypothetical protein BKA70DRAFT_1278735 [Coprinopsis sp. MPI-PUGE-AT-0042]|nr:hypothetical protein BKA70DRAFT_1278735 [Coprinopsis sp. MPI-PUGE-AT-0042]